MKKISVTFDFDINFTDESGIDEDLIRDIMCLAFGSVVSNWTDDVKSKLALKFRNTAATAKRCAIDITDVTFIHERKDEIVERLTEMKKNGAAKYVMVKTIKEQFELSLVESVAITNLFFPE